VTQQTIPRAAWGEPDNGVPPRRHVFGAWSFFATDHGLEDISHAGVRVATRVFFTVRDLSWGSPQVTYDYAPDVLDGHDLSITASVDGLSLKATGRVRVVGAALRVSFVLTAGDEVSVSRVGLCILHDRADLAPAFEADGRPFAMSDRILISRIASGYRRLDFDVESGHAVIAFEGERFEMEDQRNWADSTFKSYCPPLSDPQPIVLHRDEVRRYASTFTVEVSRSDAVASNVHPIVSRRGAELVEGADLHAMPSLGLRHPGGPLSESATARLRALRPSYLHLFVDLSSSTWRSDLSTDLTVVESLHTDSVVSVEATSEIDALAELAALLTGRASAVLLFDHGQPTTSPRLAATSSFEASGIVVGGGTRANFASLNAASSVPEPLRIIAVPLAVASHDNDRRALISSIGSFEAIVRDTRMMAGPRSILVGPVSFRPTFDSWVPPGVDHDPRIDWRARGERDGTPFAAAWTVAAVAALAECDVDRVTIGSTEDSDTPVWDAFTALAALRGQRVRSIGAGEQIRGLQGGDAIVLGTMTDAPSELVLHGRDIRLDSPAVISHSLSLPSIVS
jgi:hypothetical protein